MKKNKLLKYFITIIISIVFSASGLYAQAQVDNNAKYSSVFWEISGNNLKQTSYLFGTIHLIPKKDYKFTKKMQETFDTCKLLVLEANIDVSLTEQLAMSQKMLLPNGKTLDEFMTKKQYQNFKSYMLDSLKINSFIFQSMSFIKPIYSSVLILNELLENPTAYEQEFSKEAKKRKMEIKGLETLEFQMSLMDSISIEEQIKMLVESDVNKNPLDEYNKMLNAYKQQDLKKLHNLLEEDAQFETMKNDFVINRNIKWIASIKKIIEEQSAFIAVGAGHLYGKQGLLLLLKKEGYVLKALK